ncbi:MAG: DNA polymerase IV, partial [Candidatus Marinimicrobia bacterium]|nr:DNA polymerase IV [Candidatus Neomarinimicrobiota bacterium]
NKPNGQKTIHPSQVDEFIDTLEIKKFFGVGKVTAKKMNDLGIYYGADLRKLDKDKLIAYFGKTGSHYYKIVRSIQDSPVNPSRIRKSVGAERTFSKDIKSEAFMLDELESIANELERRMIKSKNKGRTITVKLKYNDFTNQTRSKTIESYISKKHEFFPVIEELIYQKKIERSVRLLGIAISNLYSKDNDEKEEVSIQLKFNF